jgi:DNA-binding MarR family transcriptional regulator
VTREQPPKSFEVDPDAAHPSPENFDLQINLRLHLNEVAEVEALDLRRKRPKAPSRKELCKLACRIYDARRARDRFLDRKLLGEPAWDALLALYCCPARGEVLTVTSVSNAAGVPSTTGLRWQTILHEEGLIERGPSLDGDGRRVLVRLTKQGRDLMESYLTKLYYCDTPVPAHPEAHDD